MKLLIASRKEKTPDEQNAERLAYETWRSKIGASGIVDLASDLDWRALRSTCNGFEGACNYIAQLYDAITLIPYESIYIGRGQTKIALSAWEYKKRVFLWTIENKPIRVKQISALAPDNSANWKEYATVII